MSTDQWNKTKMAKINFNVPQGYLVLVDQLVETGLVKDRSEWFRFCLLGNLMYNPEVEPILRRTAPKFIWVKDQLAKFKHRTQGSNTPQYEFVPKEGIVNE